MDDEDKNQKEISRSIVNRQVREWEDLAIMLDDMGIASTAGLSLSERVNMAIKVERRRYSAAEFKTDSMRKAFAKITHELKHAAGNRKLMQVARPARTCINLAKPFLPKNDLGQPPATGGEASTHHQPLK